MQSAQPGLFLFSQAMSVKGADCRKTAKVMDSVAKKLSEQEFAMKEKEPEVEFGRIENGNANYTVTLYAARGFEYEKALESARKMAAVELEKAGQGIEELC